MITGSPGSQAIPHTVLGIMVSVIDFDVPVQTAVWSPRFSHQWIPDQITFETPELYPEAVKVLRQLGHTVIRTGPLPQGDESSLRKGLPTAAHALKRKEDSSESSPRRGPVTWRCRVAPAFQFRNFNRIPFRRHSLLLQRGTTTPWGPA